MGQHWHPWPLCTTVLQPSLRLARTLTMQDLPSQQTASPAPLCSAHPGPASQTYKILSCQDLPESSFPDLPNLRRRQLCCPRAHEKPCVGSLIFLLSGPVILPLKCLLSPLPALTVVLPPQDSKVLCETVPCHMGSARESPWTPSPESAPLQPPRPSCHPCRLQS